MKAVNAAIGGIAAVGLVLAEDQTRALWDTAFLSQRPASATPRARTKPVQYKAVADQIAATQPAAPRSPEDTVVGITFWRLRRALPQDDPNTRLLILDEETGAEVEQVPERIEAGTPLKPGERVRLSVEVPRSGYLYVLDREQFLDGKTGPANLIYPNFQTPPGDNKVAAGRQIEVPDRRDRINSFKLVKSDATHLGEILIILVTPEPLPNVNTFARRPPVIGDAQMTEWESKYGLQVEHIEMENGAGQTLTLEEKRAGGDRSQLLTRDDPMPQTMYRVKAKPGQPMLVKVPIRIGS
ncbi:MAG: DUF4384 domain-containing protein [Bryobacteraceae bacterium]|nr:DUF4384 domain-containing protein [Bryobacteraceae bacterium]